MSKVLIIDDDGSVRALLAANLIKLGFEVLQAPSGGAGIQMAREQPPDVILCDVNMAGADGFLTLYALRRDDRVGSLPFILMSGGPIISTTMPGIERGADGVLTKPFTTEELLAAINGALSGQSRLREETAKQLSVVGADRPESGGLLTPLKQILDATDLVRSSHQHLQTQEVIGLVNDVHQHACRLQRTVENCFYYAQIGLLESDWEKIESARQQVAVVQDVIEPLAREKARQERRANDLILEFTDATVGMSADCLEKIIEELLDNAFRFSKSGSPVWLTAESTPDGTALSVRDCGRGMAPKQIAELESSLPLERMLTERHDCGLGLAVVRRLVELHQGGFGIRSELEKGTEVVVQLPAPTRGSEDAIADSADWGSLTGDRETEQALCPATA